MREWPAGVASSVFAPDSIERPQTVFSPTAYAIIASRQELHQAGLPRRILTTGLGRNRMHGYEMWIMDSMWLGRGFCAFEGEEVRREPFSAFQAIIFAQYLNTSRVWLTLNGVNLHRDCARRWLNGLVLFPEQFRATSRPPSARGKDTLQPNELRRRTRACHESESV